MNTTKLLPIAMIVMNLGAALVYAAYGDWRQVAYWAAAAVLTSAVTF